MSDPVQKERPIAPAPEAPTSSAAPLRELLHPDTYVPHNSAEAKVVAALKNVFDPEIPVNIYDLGLIYNIEAHEDGTVDIRMTLTAPGCPVAGEMPGQVAAAAETVEEVKEARVDLVWEPAWEKDRMSEDARLALGFF